LPESNHHFSYALSRLLSALYSRLIFADLCIFGETRLQAFPSPNISSQFEPFSPVTNQRAKAASLAVVVMTRVEVTTVLRNGGFMVAFGMDDSRKREWI